MDDHQNSFPSLTPVEAEELKKKLQRRDTWIGVIGTFVLNALFFGLSLLGEIVPDAFKYLFFMFSWLPWIINPLLFIVFLIRNRPRIVLGMLIAYGLAFALVLVAGVCFMIYCLIANFNL